MANNLFRIVLSVTVLIFASILFTDTSSAQPTECPAQITKQAVDAGSTVFEFTVSNVGMVIAEESLRDGESAGGSVDVGESVKVVEARKEGWVIDDIICDAAEGMEIDIMDTGVIFNCIFPTEEISNCTFVNVLANRSASIPTLSEWGMIAAAAGLGLIGFLVVRRRRAVRA